MRDQLAGRGRRRAGRRGLHPFPRRPRARHRRPAPDRLSTCAAACRSGPTARRKRRCCRASAMPSSSPQDSPYPPILDLHTIDGPRSASTAPAARSTLTPFRADHGVIDALGFRIGPLAYLPDVVAIPEESWPALEGLDCWIVDALRRKPHPTHAHLALTLDWIARASPARAVLTNMHIDLDYATLLAELPPHITPAHDGMTALTRAHSIPRPVPRPTPNERPARRHPAGLPGDRLRLCRRPRRLFTAETAVDGVMRFAQNFAVPCLLFRSIATLDLAAAYRPGPDAVLLHRRLRRLLRAGFLGAMLPVSPPDCRCGRHRLCLPLLELAAARPADHRTRLRDRRAGGQLCDHLDPRADALRASASR